MSVEPEKFEIGTPTKSEANDDDELAEGPSNVSERRIQNLVRGKNMGTRFPGKRLGLDTIAGGEVATLAHEARDDAVERRAGLAVWHPSYQKPVVD